jgi:HEAT repeat protein
MRIAQLPVHLLRVGVLAGISTLVAPSLAAQTAPAHLVEVIESPDATANEKAVAFEKLAAWGDADAVAVLESLLDNPELSHYARYALQTNPSPDAAAALREAMGRLDGDLLIGVINSIASREDEQATQALSEFLNSDDQSLAIAAAGALASIGSEEALARLNALPKHRVPALADPLLSCAAGLVDNGRRGEATALYEKIHRSEAPVAARRAAAIGLCHASSPDARPGVLEQLLQSEHAWEFEAGIQAAVEEPAPMGPTALVDALRNSPAGRQQQLLVAIKACGDRAALPAVRQATRSDDQQVRVAAISAIGTLGDASDVERLAELAKEGKPSIRSAAVAALIQIEDQEADRVMIELLQTSDSAAQALAASILGMRRSASAGPALLNLATSSNDSSVRRSALEALTRLAPPDVVPELLDLIATSENDAERALARDAALAAGQRVTDRDRAAAEAAARLETWKVEDQAVLFDLLRVIGGKRALEVVTAAAKSSDRQMQDAATRVLGAWNTPDAAPLLLRLSTPDYPFHVRALRGYLRIARQMNMDDATRLAMCRDALSLATRPNERQLALAILKRIPSATSLRLAETQLDSQSLGDAASEAVVHIAEQIASQHPQDARRAAQHVIDTGGEEQVLSRARKLVSETP